MLKFGTQTFLLFHKKTPAVSTFFHRDTLAFATEPVFASLSNVLGNYENLPSPVPSDLKEHQLYDVEIKYGLLQVMMTFFMRDFALQ